MTPDVTDLLAALPEEAQEPPTPLSPLQAMLAGLSGRPVPVGAFHRLWALGTTHARIAAAYLVWWLRSSYADADDRARQLNETHLRAALRLLGGMSYLRGVFMKVGQMLAAYPKLMPSEFAATLGKLHFEAPPMHFALLREHLYNELGGAPQELFAEFETRAFAAASLGQVHRARLRSGERVAVKVQYPNIARTIASDCRNMLALLTPMRLSRDWENFRTQFNDTRQMLEWETDYRREADFLRRARAVFSDSDGIVVPRVYDALSSERVLTMEYFDGVHLEEYLATGPSQEQRDRYGALMMRASFRIAHKAKFWYGDSNPGNYLFLRDERLGVLDFGCCREFTPLEWDYYVQVWNVYQQGGAGLREAMIRAAALDSADPQYEEYIAFLEEFSHWWSDYMMVDQPFDFGDEAFLQRGIDLFAELGKKRFFRSMPVNVWITRQLLGLRALAFRLRARINMKRIGDEETWDIQNLAPEN